MFYPFELEKYLGDLLPERDPLLQEMEEQALLETIPVVTPAVGNFLAQLVQVHNSKNILEIGTAIGYSTLWLARAVKINNGHITTIDMNINRRNQALEYFERANLSEYITSLFGDARKILPDLESKFDFAFIDAAKGEYLEYLELVTPLLESGGLLVIDNVLFRGWVVPGSNFDAKYNRMVNTLREFLTRLSQDPKYFTSVLPLGDGLAVSIKIS
ncbi:MAG: O-methyltransferase [Desulfitobacterium hafniense]|nr:O-methyltransferase [Desulfitobacterium hafniense]